MISFDRFHQQLHQVLSQDSELDAIPLEALLDSIPTVAQLQGAPEGSSVLIRADLDVPIRDAKVVDLARIESSSPTITYCIEQGWAVVIFGHIGRDKNASLAPVCEAVSKEIGQSIEFIPDWLDEGRMKLLDDVVAKVATAQPGTAFMFENTRKYDIERALWEASADRFPEISQKMYSLAVDFRNRLTEVEINEAIAASNLDFSSSVLPLVMSKTALGFYLSHEMREHIRGARRANMVVFSGLKIGKLDDLEGVLERGNLITIIAAGSLAMALKKAMAQLGGKDFDLGKAERNKKERSYISPDRIEQGKRIIKRCLADNVDLVLPIDFVLDNDEISEEIPPDRMQLDVGPKTRALFAEKVFEYIDKSRRASQQFAMFYNGVFGKFEDPRYETGTRDFIHLLRAMTEAGIETYVGGGEGRLALLKYGRISDVTHAFTAGGTILKSLSNRHIPYLKAMYLQNKAL